MRDAFTGQHGGGSMEPHYGASLGMSPDDQFGGAERLSNLHRAIDSIEQRIAGQSAGSGNDLGVMQQRLNQLSGQVGLNPVMAAGGTTDSPVLPQFEAATTDIQSRQARLGATMQAESVAQKAAVDAISNQFNALKRELASLRQEVAKPITVNSKISQGEIKRIAERLSGLQQAPAFDDQAFERLTGELGELRRSMKRDLKKEMSAANGITNRLDALAQGIDMMAVQTGNSITPRVDQLAGQIDAMRTSIEDLPQSLALTRMEDRLQQLAANIEAIPTQWPKAATPDLSSVESRLDEVARALVAVSNMGGRAPEIDLSPIDRLESRFDELSKSIDTLSQNKPESFAEEHLQGLTTRIDGLTERLGSFEKYAEKGDLGAASAMFAGPETGVIEEQLRHLSARLDEAANVNSTGAQISNLEAQIGQILRHLNKQAPQVVDFAPVEARLGQLENSIVSSNAATQQFSVEAAQLAAQQAAAMVGENSESGQAIVSLSKDLKALQQLAEGGATMNNKSIAEVQSMLEQVVDRLGTIESTIADTGTRIGHVVTEDDVPMPKASTLDPDQHLERGANAAVKAADMVVEAASADAPKGNSAAEFDDQIVDTRAEPTPKTKVNPPSLDPSAHIPLEMGSSGSAAHEDQPLEPGASPDLDKLVAQASAQLDAAKASFSSGAASFGSGADNIRPDPVGAARRALQATTAEMGAVHDEVDNGDEPDEAAPASAIAKLGGLRKPIIVAAAATLLFFIASFGYKTFMGGGEPQVTNLNTPAISETVQVEEPAPVATAETEIVAEAPRASRNIDEAAPASTAEIISGNDADPIAAPTPSVADAVSAPAEPAPVEVATAPTVEPAEQVVTSPAKSWTVPADAGPKPLIDAANSGDPTALFELGMRYSDGKTVKRDMVESAKWFERSAGAGFAPAQYSIGSLYEKGIGVEKNINTASDWYAKAALQGNARAMHNLAVIKATGTGNGDADMETAVRWFKDAANFGIKDSQFNLGILFGQGMGVPQDLAESYKWFALAAKTGDTDAAAKRDEVAKAMDPLELDETRKVVADWKPAQLDDKVNRVAVPKEWRGKGATVASGGSAMLLDIQTRLNERGYSVGAPDGVSGPKTRAAIREFQRASGMAVTGKPDKSLLRALGGNA